MRADLKWHAYDPEIKANSLEALARVVDQDGYGAYSGWIAARHLVMVNPDGKRKLDWSRAEKKAARAAFHAALERECGAIRLEAEQMMQRSSERAQLWRVHDYLSEKRLEIDRKYDYRYSVLISVLGRLLAQGWVTEADLSRLKPEKLELISRSAVTARKFGD